MSKPRLLDLFCGAGGASVGYHRAGFEVVGVDIKPQPNYPFRFIQADALEHTRSWLDALAVLGKDASWDFDAIHASPPCQAYSHGAVRFRNEGKEYPDLVAKTRELLSETGLPWVIENVPGAPMRVDIRICGCQVGLDEIRRVRWFETSWHAFVMADPCVHDPDKPVMSVTGHGNPTWTRDRYVEVYGRTPKIADYRRAMGIDWMNRDELSQAIPPAYTELIGTQLMAHLNSVVYARPMNRLSGASMRTANTEPEDRNV
jgi:DNA (cytosine-5)-methyltransferase 1